MHKKTLILGIVLGVVLSSGAWITSAALSEKKNTFAEKPQVFKESERFVDKSNGQGMAPDEMYTELQTQGGDQFDSKYISYVILLQNNLTGMNRLAKEKAANGDIKTKATEMWQSSTQTVTDLYALQRKAGYAHH